MSPVNEWWFAAASVLVVGVLLIAVPKLLALWLMSGRAPLPEQKNRRRKTGAGAAPRAEEKQKNRPALAGRLFSSNSFPV